MYTPTPISSTTLGTLLRSSGATLLVTVALGVSLLWPGGVLPTSSDPEALLTLSFDDGYQSVYDTAYPILKEHGYTGTANIIIDVIGTPSYMGLAELRELQNAGWEIASHTVTHPYLTKLDEKEIRAEVRNSKLILEELGFEIQGIATPYGDYNEQVLRVIKDYYMYHRTAWPSDLNDIPLAEEERYELKSVSVESQDSVKDVKKLILKAKEEGKWIILLFHRIGEKGKYNWSIEKFKEIVEFVDKEGFEAFNINKATN